MQLVRLDRNAYSRYLRGEIFHKLYQHHIGLRKSVDYHLAQLSDHDEVRGSSWFKPQAELLATRRLWLRQLATLVKNARADRGAELDEATAKVLVELRQCMPAPGIWQPPPRKHTCRKYAICPWCRYRLGGSIVKRMRPLVAAYQHIATVKLAFPLDDALACADDVRYLLHRLDRNRTWPCDVTVTTPQFGLLTFKWNVQVNIVALTNEPEKLTDIEDLVDLQAWHKRGVPLVSGTQWTCRKSSPTALYKAVAGAVVYAANILYAKVMVPNEAGNAEVARPMDLETFLSLGQLPTLFRTKFHGLRSSPPAS